MRKYALFLLLLLPASAFADRLGSLKSNANVLLSSQAASGGTPAGANSQVQINNGGSFGAASKVIYSTSSQLLSIGSPDATGFGSMSSTITFTPASSTFAGGHTIQVDAGSTQQQALSLFTYGTNQTTYGFWKIGADSSGLDLAAGDQSGTYFQTGAGYTDAKSATAGRNYTNMDQLAVLAIVRSTSETTIPYFSVQKWGGTQFVDLVQTTIFEVGVSSVVSNIYTNFTDTMTLSAGRVVAQKAPTNSQALAWNSSLSQWEPQTVAGSSDMFSKLVTAESVLAATVTWTSTEFGVMHVATATTTDFTITLPAAAGNQNKLLGIRVNSDSTKFVTISTGSALNTIDGDASKVLWAGEAAILLCDGTSYHKIAGKSAPMLAEIRRNSNQAISATTVTNIQFNQTDLDNTGAMADLTNFRILIKRPGKYLITGQSFYNALPANDPTLSTKVNLNGVNIFDTNSCGLATGYPSSPIVPTVRGFAANDYITVSVYTANAETMYGTSTDAASYIGITELPSW